MKEGEVRELRLEGLALGAVGAVLILALAGAFQLGRWIERGRAPEPTTAGEPAARGGQPPKIEPPLDVEATSDVFDRVGEGGAAAEPKRERGTPASASAGETAPGAIARADEAGRPWVQVAVGRDRAAGEELVRRLEADGFRGRLTADRSSGETLYKVRVGPYADEAAARAAVEALEAKGYRGAWVPPVR